jgi:hypothetical protein
MKQTSEQKRDEAVKCAACGGSGEIEAQRAKPIADEPTRGHFWRCGTCRAQNSDMDGTCQFCECEGADCTRWNCDDPRHFPICPSCHGTGRAQSEEAGK